MTTYFLPEAVLLDLICEQPESSTFLPSETEQLSWLDVAGAEPSLAGLTQPRSAQSPKGLFLPAAESLGQYGKTAKAPAAVAAEPLVLAGVRACELRARAYLDKVLKEGAFVDPNYVARGEATTVISCDCVDCTETCCCTLVGGQPYPTEGYDVNLTPLDNGYLVEVATEKGKQWLGDPSSARATQATSDQIARRDQQRKQMTERVRAQNDRFSFSADDKKQPKMPEQDDPGWVRFAADCVECGACTHICPTCHCFYLYDQALGPQQFERIRTWDSCLLGTYHRMAGGPSMKPTPRPRLPSRLANRILHKFTYSPQQYGMLGCTGCGRCVDACLGAIDIRQVVQELGK